MKMRSRIYSVLLAVVCMTAMLFVGCNGKPVTEAPSSSEQQNSSEPVPSEPESSEPESSEPEESELPDQTGSAEQLLSQMTLHEKVCQLFIVRPESLSATGEDVLTADGTILQTLEAYPVGGVALFGQNIMLPKQTQKLISGLQEGADIPLFVGVDEEGGLVARLGNNPDMGTTSFPDMMSIGDSGDSAKAYEVGFTIGSELKTFGFNLDFAPVADVATNPLNSVIGSRAFSSDPDVAAEMVEKAVEGFLNAGMICSLKHFPGHGNTAEDSHTGMATTDKTLDELRECEFKPFAAGIAAGADMVMIGHITAVNVDPDGVPATMSKTFLQDVLRKELKFDGIIITDSLEMQAITDRYTQAEAAVKCLAAGVDILLMPTDLAAAVEGIEQAVQNGELTEQRVDESVLRVLRLKEKYGILS